MKNIFYISTVLLCMISQLNTTLAQHATLNIIRDTQAYRANYTQNPYQELVLLQDYVPNVRSKIYYSTDSNFTHTVLYKNYKMLTSKRLALQLRSAAVILKKKGLGLFIFDSYRPYAVTNKMWEIVPDDRYAANPANGSDHNRGAAVDLSLYDLKTGKPLRMPTGFDNFTDSAHIDFDKLPKEVLANRKYLIKTMESVGLKVLKTEWWHFYLPNSKEFPILNLSFDNVPTAAP